MTFHRNSSQEFSTNGGARERFEPIVIAAPDSVALFPDARLLPDDFEQAVAALRRARCDVLHFWKAGSTHLAYFLPFVRCAPVQCTSYGTQGNERNSGHQ